MTFKGIVYVVMIEYDFDKRERIEMASLGTIEDSEKIREFKKLDDALKVNDNHRHYYVQTYDTVFEIISDRFELSIEA